MSTQPRTAAGSWGLRATVALVVSATALWFAFRGIDGAELYEQLENTRWEIWGLYILSQLAVHLVRVVRWGLLVRPLGDVSWRTVFVAGSLGLPATFFLPLRLGEFVRPAMMGRTPVGFAGGFASVVVERTADGLLNVLLFFAILGTLPEDALAPEVRRLSWVALAFFSGGVVALAFGYFAREVFLKAVKRGLRVVSVGFADRATATLRLFLEGLVALASPSRLLGFVGLTALYWVINGAATWALAESYSGELPLIAGPFAVSVVVFAIMIPAGPAFAGTLEVGFRLGLRPFGVAAGPAAAVALAAHAMQILTFALIAGVGFLSAAPGSLQGLTRRGTAERER